MTPGGRAASRRAYLIESGPAAGVIACAHLARLTGRPNMISLDMGGTTAKAAMLEDGEPVRTSEYEIGAGINLSSSRSSRAAATRSSCRSSTSRRSAPAAARSSRSTSSASRASARTAPAPLPGRSATGAAAPSRRSRTRWPSSATSTRRSSPAAPSRWTSRPRARRSRRRVADRLGRSVVEAAYGVLMLAVATMTRAVKAVSTYRGRDPRDFALCAFGGNGPRRRRRDRPRAQHAPRSRPACPRRVQRRRPALLRHRAGVRANAAAPRRRDRPGR